MQKVRRFALELSAWSIKKMSILPRRESAEQERADMHRPVPRCPFQALQPACNMFRRRSLPASITWERN
jgi:hypothetical protein